MYPFTGINYRTILDDACAYCDATLHVHMNRYYTMQFFMTIGNY